MAPVPSAPPTAATLPLIRCLPPPCGRRRLSLAQVRDEIAKYKVGAPARVGAAATEDVVIKSGSTGMDPSQTSFFQALGIATKINKGTIEIVSDVTVVKVGERVGPSQATLLSKLGIKPFKYGLLLHKVRWRPCAYRSYRTRVVHRQGTHHPRPWGLAKRQGVCGGEREAAMGLPASPVFGGQATKAWNGPPALSVATCSATSCLATRTRPRARGPSPWTALHSTPTPLNAPSPSAHRPPPAGH